MNSNNNANSGQIKFNLCGVDGCCPEVTLDMNEKMAIIKDDFGGSIKITLDQLFDLEKKLIAVK